MGQLFKMDYSAVSQAAKTFEQESKVNHKIGEIKQKMITTLRENLMSKVETLLKIETSKSLQLKTTS